MRKWIYLAGVLCLCSILLQPVYADDKPKNIMLLFDLNDHNKEIESTIDLFFKKVLNSRDQIMVMTPANKIYSYSSTALRQSRNKINREVREAVRKHTSVSGSDYKNIYSQMLRIVEEIREQTGSQDVKNLIAAYENHRDEMKRTRSISEDLLLKLSDVFQRSQEITGDTENLVYLFLQKELRPIPDKNSMDRIRDNPQLAFKAAEVFLGERSRTDFNAQQIGEAFKKAGVTFHFIYISPKEISTQRYQLIDNSGDFYSAMSVIADMTGGNKITTSQPKTIFEE